MEPNLLDRMLETYKTERTNVAITLQNKIRVVGKVSAFDSYVLVLDGTRREIVYRHAIASLAPQEVHEAHPVQPHKASPSAPRPKARPQEKPRTQQTRAPQPRPEHAAKDSGINTVMKEELLKWMQGQKAAK